MVKEESEQRPSAFTESDKYKPDSDIQFMEGSLISQQDASQQSGPLSIMKRHPSHDINGVPMAIPSNIDNFEPSNEFMTQRADAQFVPLTNQEFHSFSNPVRQNTARDPDESNKKVLMSYKSSNNIDDLRGPHVAQFEPTNEMRLSQGKESIIPDNEINEMLVPQFNQNNSQSTDNLLDLQ